MSAKKRKIKGVIKEEVEEKNSFDELLDTLSSQVGIQIDDPQSKSKTSFYITRLTQVFFKMLSDTYGLPQGDMINWSPWIIASFMQRSLDRRKRSVVTLRTLEQQIQSSISAMESVAPHLSHLLHYPSEMISQLVDLEENAVDKKVISGLGIKEFDEGLFSILSEPFESEPAYQKDLDELIGDQEAIFLNLIKNLKEKEAGDEHKDDKPRTNSD